MTLYQKIEAARKVVDLIDAARKFPVVCIPDGDIETLRAAIPEPMTEDKVESMVHKRIMIYADKLSMQETRNLTWDVIRALKSAGVLLVKEG